MATDNTIAQVVNMLFHAPLANKPEAGEITAVARIFRATLADIEDSLLVAAATQHIAMSKWFPAVADLRQAAVALVHRVDGVPDSYTAWQQVKQASANGWGIVTWHTAEDGSFQKCQKEPTGVHPMAVKALNTLGGIGEFHNRMADDEPSWRARFISAYEQLQQRQAEDGMMLPAVAGYIEARRELNGDSVGGMIAALTGRMQAP